MVNQAPIDGFELGLWHIGQISGFIHQTINRLFPGRDLKRGIRNGFALALQLI
jgi:hypothetical protein